VDIQRTFLLQLRSNIFQGRPANEKDIGRVEDVRREDDLFIAENAEEGTS
jgi:hypothetical protein